MEIFRSILTIFIIVSGFVCGLMVLAYLYSPRGAAGSEISRANAVVDDVVKGSRKPTFEYWINVGYLWLLKNLGRILLTSIGVLITSVLVLRILCYKGA